ncbi:MAG: hypothetical protein JO269_11315 [Burkholderiaceae bacterium]|nr:hypothetical protein [Burkholderiaceae bacterium]
MKQLNPSDTLRHLFAGAVLAPYTGGKPPVHDRLHATSGHEADNGEAGLPQAAKEAVHAR